MNKMLINCLIVQLGTMIICPSELIAQGKSSNSYSHRTVPKHKHHEIRKLVREKFVDTPEKIEGLSKDESDNIINKIKNIIYKERHENIKRIIEQENLTHKDIQDLIHNIQEEKKELKPKIKEAIKHINKLLKQKLKENVDTDISKDKFKEAFNKIKFDCQKEISKENKEHEDIIEKLKECIVKERK